MIRVSNVKLNVNDSDIKKAVCKNIKISEKSIKELYIRRKSLDARKKDDIHYLYTVDIVADDEKKILNNKKLKNVSISNYKKYSIPDYDTELKNRPVIVGFGPAGMFAGLVLAEKGLKPIILERGKAVDERTADVENFWNGGKFNPESNVQFGEGGAGTFSDGKLTTRIKDNRCSYVTESFVAAGAPEEILYDAKL